MTPAQVSLLSSPNAHGVADTASAMEAAAKQLRAAADELDRLAVETRKRGDLYLAADAVNCVAGVVSTCRLDMLVVWPLRALGAPERSRLDG